MNTPEHILELFQKTSNEVEKCYGFDIQYWLTKYEQLRKITVNFPEAALLIVSAASIYGRKVDFLESLILNMNVRTADEEQKKTTDVQKHTKIPKKLKKSLQEANSNYVEFNAKPIKQSASTQEKISNQNGNNEDNEFDNIVSLESMTRKGNKPSFYRRINLLQSDLNSKSTFGSISVSDKDFDEVDCRKNYRVFMDEIDTEKNGLVDKTDLSKETESVSSKPFQVYMPATYVRNEFDIELADNSDHLNMVRYQQEISQVLRLNINELYNYKNGRNLNAILTSKNCTTLSISDSGIFSNSSLNESQMLENELNFSTETNDLSTINTTPANLSIENFSSPDQLSSCNTTQTLESSSCNTTQTIENPSPCNLNKSDLTSENFTPNLTQTSENLSSCDVTQTLDNSSIENPSVTTTDTLQISTQLSEAATKELTITTGRISIDEGIESCAPSPTMLIEDFEQMDSLNKSMLSPVVELFDICYPFNNEIDADFFSFRLNKDEYNLFRIANTDYLRYEEQFKLPIDMFTRNIPLSINFFKLPHSRLRRQIKFSLPKDDYNVFKRKSDLSSAPNISEMVKRVKLNAAWSGELNAEVNESNGFLGFDLDDIEIPLTEPAIDIIADDHIEEFVKDTSIAPAPVEEEADTSVELLPSMDLTANVSLPPLDQSKDISDIPTDSGIGQSMLSECSESIFDNSLRDFNVSVPPLDLSKNISDTQTDSGIGQSMLSECSESIFDNSLHDSMEITSPAENGSAMPENRSIPTCDISVNPKNSHRIDEIKEMNDRVTKWHESLRPIIAQSQKRNHFDINEIGGNIIDCCAQTSNGQVNFNEIMKNRENGYTARYFLALLQLTNNKNVELNVRNKCPNRASQTEDIVATLLSTTRKDYGSTEPCFT